VLVFKMQNLNDTHTMFCAPVIQKSNESFAGILEFEASKQGLEQISAVSFLAKSVHQFIARHFPHLAKHTVPVSIKNYREGIDGTSMGVAYLLAVLSMNFPLSAKGEIMKEYGLIWATGGIGQEGITPITGLAGKVKGFIATTTSRFFIVDNSSWFDYMANKPEHDSTQIKDVTLKEIKKISTEDLAVIAAGKPMIWLVEPKTEDLLDLVEIIFEIPSATTSLEERHSKAKTNFLNAYSHRILCNSFLAAFATSYLYPGLINTNEKVFACCLGVYSIVPLSILWKFMSKAEARYVSNNTIYVGWADKKSDEQFLSMISSILFFGPANNIISHDKKIFYRGIFLSLVAFFTIFWSMRATLMGQVSHEYLIGFVAISIYIIFSLKKMRPHYSLINFIGSFRWLAFSMAAAIWKGLFFSLNVFLLLHIIFHFWEAFRNESDSTFRKTKKRNQALAVGFAFFINAAFGVFMSKIHPPLQDAFQRMFFFTENWMSHPKNALFILLIAINIIYWNEVPRRAKEVMQIERIINIRLINQRTAASKTPDLGRS